MKINWDEVEAIKTRLLREGATEISEMVVVVLYHTRSECDKIQIRLGQLEKSLFNLCGKQDVRSLLLFDIAMKKPYLKCEAPERTGGVEAIPNSGHTDVVSDFKNMSQAQRDVWVDIAFAGLQHYVNA